MSDAPIDSTQVTFRAAGGIPAPLRSVQREAGRQKRGLAQMRANHTFQRKQSLIGGQSGRKREG